MTANRRNGAPAFSPPRDGKIVAEAVRNLLQSKGFTLYRVAALSRFRYPSNSAYGIRRNFYFQLRSGQSPAWQQIVALAELTKIRLPDWLKVFGFLPSNISRLQAVLMRPRTGRIDEDPVDERLPLPIFRYDSQELWPAIAPFPHLLESTGSERATATSVRREPHFVYAKVGRKDGLVFPELTAGAIVRADPRRVHAVLRLAAHDLSRYSFLLSTNDGLTCARLRVTRPHHLALIAADETPRSIEMRISKDLRIVGVIDLELRFRRASRRREQTQNEMPSYHYASKSVFTDSNLSPQKFLERARLKAGLSFPAASQMSRTIAAALGDSRYFASPGTLSDYEASSKLPRHIHKLFTLSIVYAIRFRDLLAAFGAATGTADTGDQRMSRAAKPRKGEQRHTNRFDRRDDPFGEVPLFLAPALQSLAGIARVTLRDLFWVGREARDSHPALAGALFVLLNRHCKSPRFFPHSPLRLQPVYLLQDRDGEYRFASCSAAGDRIIVHTSTNEAVRPETNQQKIDAEVLGQVVAIARSMLPPI